MCASSARRLSLAKPGIVTHLKDEFERRFDDVFEVQKPFD